MPEEPTTSLNRQLMLINLHAALERLGGDQELLREVAGDFLDTYEALFEEVVRAVETKNAEDLRLHAHALKGALRNFGADEAQAAAYRLETMGRLAEFAGSEAALACLRVTLEDLRAEMELVAQR